MAGIKHLTLEVPDTAAAEQLYVATLGLGDLVRLEPAEAPSSGFGGCTLSLVAAEPGDVDILVANALAAGATSIKPAKKSLWGYGGVIQGPDGTICTVASSSKKDTRPATGKIEEVVLQLGVTDVGASKDFYVGRGLTVSKSYGKKYVELDTGRVQLALLKRAALAKASGVPAGDTGSHRIRIGSEAGPFTDPDGFVWEAST